MKEQIANILTLTNFSLGFISIFLSIQGLFLYAAYFIIAAVAIDAVDGTVSRLLKTSSVFGKELDNTSDFVSSALAPSVFSYLILSDKLLPPFSYIFIALLLAFVLSGLIRTARLNSGQITKWNGMMITFNVLIPFLYISNFFSLYIISGWMLLSSVFMLSKFSLRDAFRRKRPKEKTLELKSESENEEPEKSKSEEKEEGLVPLSIFGD